VISQIFVSSKKINFLKPQTNFFQVLFTSFLLVTLAFAAPAPEEKVEKKEGDLQTASSFYGGKQNY